MTAPREGPRSDHSKNLQLGVPKNLAVWIFSGEGAVPPPRMIPGKKSKNIEQISNFDLLLGEAKKILEKYPKEVQDYKNGKDKLMGFFVGQIMKETQGKANPRALNQILNKLLKGK